MRPIISLIGGTFDNSGGKESGIIRKMTNIFQTTGNMIINGGYIETLRNKETKNSISTSKMIIWMPNIDNEEEKDYPVKGIGSILICSKVMREGYTKVDAVSRIFKMHGNAVIAIYKNPGECKFILYDALGNTWYEGYDIKNLCIAIYRFMTFMLGVDRQRTTKSMSLLNDVDKSPEDLDKFISLNNKLAGNIMTSCGNRFFGNLSTRCQKLFPTRYDYGYMWVSPRNTDKAKLEVNDMVIYDSKHHVYACENIQNKPSVDSPVQANIYKAFPNIHYMIHGHAFINPKDNNIRVQYTDNYYPCGDLRELEELTKCINGVSSFFGVINLKGHGFILFSNSLEEMEYMINSFNSEDFSLNTGNIFN